ncbi:UNVERIFIED_CONTAM: hypothetical protein RMT77_010732 [Armadillidium vulgare]
MKLAHSIVYILNFSSREIYHSSRFFNRSIGYSFQKRTFIKMSESLHISSAEEKSPSKHPRKIELNSPKKEWNYPLKELQLSALNGEVSAKGIKRKRPFTVAVEGNIGSGKSTFLNYFSKLPNVLTFEEPIDKWTNVSGNNLLQMLYEDPSRWSFLFQSYVQLTRLNIHLQNSNSDVKIIERSFQNNRFCFVECALEAGNLSKEEYSVLTSYYDFFENNCNIGIDLIVYLRTTPEVVYERMKLRGRKEEKNVPLEYMKQVHKFYEKWLIDGKPQKPSAPIIILNGDLNVEQVFEEYEKHKPIIMGSNSVKKS